MSGIGAGPKQEEPSRFERRRPMLAEKFFLYLETLLRSRAYLDGGPRVVSTSPHVAVKLPDAKRD
jgi:hypothetical protein